MKLIAITGILFFMFGCIHIPQTTDYNSTLQNMEINGYKFHVKTAGNKKNPPLIVIHGGPGGDFNYLLNLEKLADEFNLLFYDQRMTGLSPRKSEIKGGIEQDILDLHKIVKIFSDNKKVILIGHSYGGMIATGFLSKYPELVEKAVIIEPGILTRNTAYEFASSYKRKSSIFSSFKIVWPLFKSIFIKSEDGHERTDYVMTNILGSGKGQPYQCEGISLPKNSFVRGGFRIFNTTMRPMMDNPDLFNTDLVTGLKKFQGQIMLLSSNCSFIGYDYQETFHRKYFPDHTLHVNLNDTGHNFIATDPNKSIPIIREFLKTNHIKTINPSFSADMQNRLQYALQQQIKNGHTPGVQYTVVSSDQILFQFSIGKANINLEKPVESNTTFHAFSITKIFTSYAILQLLDQEKLKLEDKISKYLPEIPYDRNITIYQLLNHTSGIPNPLPLKWIHPIHEPFDYKNFTHELLEKNPEMKSRPGYKMSYSNIEYLLLGEIIEKISGMEYKKYIKKNILDKIGISHEDLDFTLNTSLHAEGYIKKYSFLNFAFGFLVDKKKLLEGEENGWIKFKKFYLNGPAYGGLIGTSKGLAKFLQTLLDKKENLISQKSRDLLFTKSHLGEGKKIDTSLGWFYGELDGIPYYTHAGGGGGYYTEVRIYPTRNLASVIMFNRTGVTDERFLDNIDKIIFEQTN